MAGLPTGLTTTVPCISPTGVHHQGILWQLQQLHSYYFSGMFSSSEGLQEGSQGLKTLHGTTWNHELAVLTSDRFFRQLACTPRSFPIHDLSRNAVVTLGKKTLS